jgi:hypothetical protein
MLVLTLTPHPTKPNVLQWSKYVLSTEFEPAAPYVIVTQSDCNLLSCDRSDEIVYLPVTVTDTHIRSIIDLNLNMMSGFTKQNLIKN